MVMAAGRRHAFANRRLERDLYDGSGRGDPRSVAGEEYPNIVLDDALLRLNVCTFKDQFREMVLAAFKRIINGEATGSRAPKPPAFTVVGEFPLTTNDERATAPR
jgi:metal-dependent amidase/aminoacylase/carboxypeptidase family protein